jgi:hypothetical protein
MVEIHTAARGRDVIFSASRDPRSGVGATELDDFSVEPLGSRAADHQKRKVGGD